jgi:hypothetical protein
MVSTGIFLRIELNFGSTTDDIGLFDIYVLGKALVLVAEILRIY